MSQQVKKVIRLKKPEGQANPVEVKRIIKMGKSVPIPPVNLCARTNTEEAFEILREY